MRLRTKSFLLVILVALLLLPIVLWFATNDSRRIALEVQRLVGLMEDDYSDETHEAHNKLIALGPKAYDELRRILTARSNHSGWYPQIWRRLPPPIRAQMPDPGAREALRRKLQNCLPSAGPVLCRALTGAICTALENGDAGANEMTLLRALIWSIPEFDRAVMTLSNHVAHVTNNFLFGYLQGDLVWRDVPHLAPLLAQWLRHKDAMPDAARGLANLGTNALFAVPLLVEAAESGFATPIVQPSITVSYAPGYDLITMNRIDAIEALAKVGATNSAVMAALMKAAESNNDELRFAAYLACLELQIPISEELRAWADKWDPFEGNFLVHFTATLNLNKLGLLGARALPSIPLLHRIASGAGRNTAASPEDPDGRSADVIRLTAIASLFEIDPAQAAPHFPFVLEKFNHWDATNLLRQWTGMRERILPEMVKQLENEKAQLRAAFIIHALAPDLEEPRSILVRALSSNDPATKSTAVNWLWTLHQDPSEILPATRQLLASSEDHTIQAGINVLEMMGDAGRPAFPEVQRLLTSRNWVVRDRAGHLLRRLSPADMPPIIDD
jgi:HEAT repeat protein